MRERGWPVVMGNADAFVLDEASAVTGVEAVTDQQRALRAWTLEQLSPKDREFLAPSRRPWRWRSGRGRYSRATRCPPRTTRSCCPRRRRRSSAPHLDGVEADIVAAGHVHLQFIRRAGATLWVNPGSVGLSYDHEQPEGDFRFDPWAAYGFVAADQEGRLSIELRRVPVDVEAIVARVEACGLPGAAEGAWRWQARN